MHWAAHGHTAADVIIQRADAALPYMGLTSFGGPKPRKSDVGIAENYLKKEELEALNKIVSAYLEFAELQAHNRKPMHMRDWIVKLDDFLQLSERDILSHAGSISHETAISRAEAEFERYHIRRQLREPERVEKDFEQAIQKIMPQKPKLKSKRKQRP